MNKIPIIVGDGVTDGRDHLGAAAFGEVGDEFDKLHITAIEDLDLGLRWRIATWDCDRD